MPNESIEKLNYSRLRFQGQRKLSRPSDNLQEIRCTDMKDLAHIDKINVILNHKIYDTFHGNKSYNNIIDISCS